MFKQTTLEWMIEIIITFTLLFFIWRFVITLNNPFIVTERKINYYLSHGSGFRMRYRSLTFNKLNVITITKKIVTRIVLRRIT